jgi:uncharacterized membrane protein
MEKQNTKKNKFKIPNLSIWQILGYFIIYSIIGFVIETIFGICTKGVLESRRSFLYGPFCSIYGIGAVVMIYFLQYFKKNNYTLFFGGFIIGSVIEYVISFIGELIFNIKWWDYSNLILNINGRICLTFSLFWGLLAIYLISHFNPKIDKLINKIKEKISEKILKIAVIVITIFILIDAILTAIGLKIFFTRIIYENDLKVKNASNYTFNYDNLKKNKKLYDITNKLFSDKKMLRTFPNLRLTAEDNSIIYVDSLLPEIQPYYIKLYTPKYQKIYNYKFLKQEQN